MINLKNELSGRPGFCTAVLVMIEGLKRQDKRQGFEVDMRSFGGITDPKHKANSGTVLCFGCAATCAIQEYFGVDFDAYNILSVRARAGAVNTNEGVVCEFEDAIENLRADDAYCLSVFCALEEPDCRLVSHHFDCLPILNNDSWRDELPKYESALDDIMVAWGKVKMEWTGGWPP